MTSCCLAILTLVAAAPPEALPVDFDSDVVPVLTRSGCNAGACHGAAIGRGGFKLSLYGGDPAADFDAIKRQLKGRRINLARPDESLLLLKPTNLLDHGGGERLDDVGAALVERWIREGGNRAKTRRLVELKVEPREFVGKPEETLSLRAIARFDDGTKRDVTRWTVWRADDESSVEIDQAKATAKVLRRGRHLIVARYLDRVVPLALIVPLSDEKVVFQATAHRNRIDDFVLRTLRVLRLPASPPADDFTWLRRVRLDLTGQLPSPSEIESFRKDRRAGKRDAKLEQLLESPKFAEYWTFRLAQLLRIRTQPKDKKSAAVYHAWLRRQLDRRVGYDQIARQLLTASGDTTQNGPANFYRTVQGARKQAEFFSELLMGARLRCANCHNHPLDRWTQDDYHGLSAIFARVQQGRIIKVVRKGEVTHPRTGEAARLRIPGQRFLSNEKRDPRLDLADWITGPDNPYFARAIVNRLWKAMLGRGLIEPTDDVRASNPPTHPELLDYLVQDFVNHKYDLRHTLKRIASSATYQRSAIALKANRADDRFYSRAMVRALDAEVQADALAHVTEVAEKYPGFPIGTSAVSLFDPQVPSTALDVLGRCAREESCESSGTGSQGGLSQKLHLANGRLINAKITSKQGRLARMISAGESDAEIVKKFYLLGLSRFPTSREAAYWSNQLRDATGKERTQTLEDFLWSLLSCREFVTNH